MTRVGWREFRERFNHIDARFVGCEVGLPQNDGFFTVAMYPFWEHPLYLAHRNDGKNWGFTDHEDGFREVTVYPKKIYQFSLSQQSEVIDWDFTQEHPVLWQYEESAAIACNSPLTLEKWMEISVQVKNQLSGYNREVDIANYGICQVHQWGHTSSFSLGSYPYTVFGILCQVLDDHDIHYFVSSVPQPKALPVLFLIDGSQYIVAEDFEIEVPEFVHKAEWFQPR